MSRLTQAGATAGIALALVGACLNGPASASTPSPAAAVGPALAAATDATPDKAFDPSSRSAAMKLAQSKAATIAKSLGLGAAEALKVKDVERDSDGTVHLRYTRTLGGLPVMGGDFVVHESAAGTIEGTDFASDQPLALDAKAPTKVSAAAAAGIAARVTGVGALKAGSASKIVWAVSGVPRLAWLTNVGTRDENGYRSPTAVVVDARTGREIQRWSLHQEATGRGRSLYSGAVRIATAKQGNKFVLKDTARGGSITVDVRNRFDPQQGFLKGTIFSDPDNRWGNGKPSNRQSAAVDVAYGTAKTWDFYKKTFHRTGIANNGKGAKSRVHYGRNYDNAFWNDGCFCMTYGDGGQLFKPLTQLDVAGHEMSHGVTSRTAGLYYFGDAGGLNESTSDIFGTSVEFYAKNKKDKGDYYIGEKIWKPALGHHFLRRMDNPATDGASYNCWAINMGLDDPHLTSGPGNHFFYLLSEGSGAERIGGLPHNSPRCAGAPAVQGIGRAKADQIWYRALTRYFVSTTGYIDARDNTIRAAIDLYGKNSGACKQVVRAWNAVGVPKQYYTCKGGLSEGKNKFAKSPGFERNRNAWTGSGSVFLGTRNNSVPRSGKFDGILNTTGDASNGFFEHSFTVPDTATAHLRFYMFISRGVNPQTGAQSGSGTIDVTINGNVIPNGAGHWDQSYANNTYVRWDIPLELYAGQPVTMRIAGHEDASGPSFGYFGAYIDDFTVTAR